MGGRVAHLVTGTMLEYVALDDDFAIVETAVPAELDGSGGAGPIAQRYGVTVVCVKPRGSHTPPPRPTPCCGPAS